MDQRQLEALSLLLYFSDSPYLLKWVMKYLTPLSSLLKKTSWLEIGKLDFVYYAIANYQEVFKFKSQMMVPIHYELKILEMDKQTLPLEDLLAEKVGMLVQGKTTPLVS